MLVERLAGEISKYKKEIKMMKNERKKRKKFENKGTQVDWDERTKSVHSDKQVLYIMCVKTHYM